MIITIILPLHLITSNNWQTCMEEQFVILYNLFASLSCYVSLNNTTIRYLHVQTLILATPQLLEMAAQPHSFKYLHHHICVYMRVIMCQAVAVNIHNE